MKKSLRLFIALLLLYFGYQASFAQSFVRLFDATGRDHSSHDQMLLDSTDALLDIFISDSFADSFAIYDFGFYLHNEIFQGGFPGVFDQVVSQVAAGKEYYVLVGRAYDSKGGLQLYVKSKLPSHGDFECLEDTDRASLDNIVRSAIEETLGSEVGISQVNVSMAEGIRFLADRLNYLLYCSCPASPNRRSQIQCPSEHGFDEINILLRGLGWRRTEISNVRSSTWDNSNDIYDFANKEFLIDGEMVTIPEQIVESKATFDSLMSGKVYILDNESFNNGEWETFLAESSNPANDYVEGWVIANDDDQFYLYSIYFIGIGDLPAAIPQVRVDFNGRSVVLPAMKYVLQVLGNAALDACMQAVIHRVFFKEIDTWDKAFDKVSYLGAVWEGISSLLPWKKAKKLGPIMRAATSALVEVIDKANRDDNYTITQGFVDFAIGFGTTYLIDLATHPKVREKISTEISEVYARFGDGLVRWYDETQYQLIRDMVEPVIRLVSPSKHVVRFGCFIAGTPVVMACNNYSGTKALSLAASMPIVAVPIQDVQLLNYAVAHETVNSPYGLSVSASDDVYLGLIGNDHYTSDQQRERDEYEINDVDWNEVVFEEVYGSSRAKLALHQDWIDRKSLVVDGVVNLDLPEMGISGRFRITSIKHILPQKKPVDEDRSDNFCYRPVTALFTHVSDEVYNIDFDNGDQLGVTYRHPIYSTTLGDWRLAGELEVGEEVFTKFGNTKVVSSTKKEGSETVYNLEIKELHNFLVGESGIVVHNNYGIIQALIDGIHNATKAFHKPYKCQEYSQALRAYFKNNGRDIKTKRWQLTNDGNDVSTVIGFDMPNGTTINISTNGFHEFTIINDKIFDNNIFDGMPIAEFMNRIQIPPGLGVREIDIID